MIKIKTGTLPSSGRIPIYGQISSNQNSPQLEINVPSHKFAFLVSMTGSSWTMNESTTYVAQADTDYYVKFYFTGEKYIGEVMDINKNILDSVEFIDNRKAVMSGPFNFGKDDDGAFSNGIIDLTETYIKVDGEIWWQPYIEVPVGQINVNI